MIEVVRDRRSRTGRHEARPGGPAPPGERGVWLQPRAAMESLRAGARRACPGGSAPTRLRYSP
jgi:hypothetical protein